MSVRKEVFYHNAKVLLGKPAKRVWFRLNPLLEKTSLFVTKKQDHSQFTMPLQSVVICERILEDQTAFQATCTEADFWDYLFSENWRGWSSVRVFHGQLMECLMEALHTLEETKAIASRETAIFTQNIRHIKRPLKGADAVKELKEKLKISFTYYGARKGKLDSMFDNLDCPTDTMSVPDIEDTLLSDDEFAMPDSEVVEKYERPQSIDYSDSEVQRNGSRRAISFASGSDGNISPKIRESFSSISEYEDEIEDGFDVLTPNRVLNSMRAPHMSYKEWIKNRDMLKECLPGDKSPYLASIYTLPHFHCPRPPRSQSDGSSVMDKRDVASHTGEADIENSAGWLIQTMENTKKCSQRTVDRLRKRLEELVEERNRAKRKRKPVMGQHLAEATRLAANYASTPMVSLSFTRCHKVPTFEQYLLKLVKDRDFDQRYRGNRRRIYKLSQRSKPQKHKDESDFIVDETLAWRSPTNSPRKKGRNKMVKVSGRKSSQKEKNQRSPTKSKVAAWSPIRSAAIEEVAAGPDNMRSTEDTEGNEDVPENLNTENFVEIIVGITDCVAFRNNLAMINESDEEDRPTSQLSPAPDLDSSTSMDELNTTDRETAPSEVKSTISLTPSPLTPADLKGIDDTQSRQGSPRSNRADSLSSTPPKSPASNGSPEKLSNENSPNKSPTDLDDLEAESSRGPSDPLVNPEENASPVPDVCNTPDLFDARKINRKYSFDKLKAKRKHQKKQGFRDILKKFTKIQKIAAVFRQSAMIKPKKGKQKKKFTNPLCMSPSPEPHDNFIGKVTERRGGIVPEEVTVPDFRYPTAAEFRSKLLTALDQFVVRKEQVISNYKNRSLTSITFTRPEIFCQVHTNS